MLGTRIRQARLLAGMSQQDVVDALGDAGFPTNQAKIIAYEKDRDIPNAPTLMEMSRVFNVPPVWLMHKPKQDVVLQGYRKQSTLRARTRDAIETYVCDVAELYIELRSQIYPNMTVNFPDRTSVADFDGAEKAAKQLRRKWQLGDAPIPNLTHIAEANGVVVVDWHRPTKQFDGLSVWYGQDVPVIVAKCDVTADRKRFNLAHELGHLVMQTPGGMPDKQTERLAHRFAGAFLVPAEVAIKELGKKRESIAISELGELKQKYGLSMQGWVFRAKDLGIITPDMASSFWPIVNQQGWKKREPYEFASDETPTLLKQMISYALDEGLVAPYRILQVFPAFKFDSSKEFGIFPTAGELLSMPKCERKRFMDISFALAKDEDFEVFEVFGEEEL